MSRSHRITVVLWFLGGLAVFLTACERTPEIVQPEYSGMIEPTANSTGDLQLRFPDLRGLIQSPTTRAANSLPPPECLPGDPCDDGDEELSDSEFAALLPATIVRSQTWTTGTVATVAEGYGHQTFTGSFGLLQTDMDLYFQGDYVVHDDDDDLYNITVTDWLSQALGWCSTLGQLLDGQSVMCPHELDTRISGILLKENCGHRMELSSDHYAENILKAVSWGYDEWETSAVRAQAECEVEGNPGGGGGDGPPPLCDEYTCIISYWVDTGEVIDSYCWCSHWAD